MPGLLVLRQSMRVHRDMVAQVTIVANSIVDGVLVSLQLLEAIIASVLLLTLVTFASNIFLMFVFYVIIQATWVICQEITLIALVLFVFVFCVFVQL